MNIKAVDDIAVVIRCIEGDSAKFDRGGTGDLDWGGVAQGRVARAITGEYRGAIQGIVDVCGCSVTRC